MPILSNPRHERFAQELSKGRSATEAYEAAGFKPSRHNAARLSTNDNIRARLAELQAASAERAKITLEGLLDRADRAYDLAMRIEEPNAAINAVKEMGILSGDRVEKSERKNLNFDAADLTDSELARIARGGSDGTPEEKRGTRKSDRVH